MTEFSVRHFVTAAGRDIYANWHRSVGDVRARIAIDRRINRLEMGNFGDHKFCRDGVWELRIDVGRGYRVYYALSGKRLILLLCAGDKRSQKSDIDAACKYWRDWQERLDG